MNFIAFIPILVGALGSAGSALIGTLISKLVTEKMMIRIIVIVCKQIEKSSSNNTVDSVMKEVIEALEA